MSSSKCKWICFKKLLLIGNTNCGKTTLCSYLANASSESVHKAQTITKTNTISSCAFDAAIPQKDEMQSTDDKMYILTKIMQYRAYKLHL